jgi:hypothetical protein
MTVTQAEVLTRYDVEIPAHLRDDAEVPICTGLIRQGDCLLVPTRKGKVAGLEPIPAEGIAVIRGEAGGNTHLLVGDGLYARRASRAGADQGTLVVEKGPAWLLHPEHGATGIGPGTYIARRQRVQEDEIRLVRD